MTQIKKCPHCGSDSGFYTKDYVKGAIHTYYNMDGTEETEGMNSEMYDSLIHKQGKIAYCTSCNKKLFKISEDRQ